jgi:hypothetical protein
LVYSWIDGRTREALIRIIGILTKIRIRHVSITPIYEGKSMSKLQIDIELKQIRVLI